MSAAVFLILFWIGHRRFEYLRDKVDLSRDEYEQLWRSERAVDAYYETRG